MEKLVGNLFGDFIKDSVFKNRKLLTWTWIPTKDFIVHRKKELEMIAKTLSPLLQRESPSNCIIYGPPGSGKTVSVMIVKKDIEEIEEKNNYKIIYVKCGEYRTKYQILAKIGDTLSFGYSGTNTSKYYELLKKFLKDNLIVLILDEMDKIQDGNDTVFNFTRLENLSLIGIANNLNFTKDYETNTLSSLSERTIMFNRYNAMQLRDILKKRAKEGFHSNVISEGVINKCAALAAQEHGDARKALDLLRASGEIADDEKSKKILETHVDKAEKKLDLDLIVEAVKNIPLHSKILLSSIIDSYYNINGEQATWTGSIYITYEKKCKNYGIKALTQRRISDLISELDDLGIIKAMPISHGRYGKTREISMELGEKCLQEVQKIFDINQIP